MESALVELTGILRQNGLRISTAELEDALKACAAVGLSERDRVRAALEATLVKREADVEPFRQVFELFFTGTARTFAAVGAALARRIEDEGLLEGDELAMVLATLQQLHPGLSPLGQAVLGGDAAGLARLFRGAALELDLASLGGAGEVGFFARRLLAGAGAERMREDLAAIERELKARGASARGIELVSGELAQALRRVEALARAQVESSARAAAGRKRGRAFAALSPQELRQAEGAVRRLAEKLKGRLMARHLSRRKGALHARKTLRHNLAWGGVPMLPWFRRRRPERPDVVVLCDVSDSVRNVSRLMLAFMHTLQSLVVRVRSFVFVSDIGEVTGYFKGAELPEALEAALSGRAAPLTGNSNYGRALSQFAERELPSLTRRTTVVVIGDGRSNLNPSGLTALRDVRRRCKRLLWICPEDRSGWGAGDSEMLAYEAVASQVVVVQSLDDLVSLADKLLPP